MPCSISPCKHAILADEATAVVGNMLERLEFTYTDRCQEDTVPGKGSDCHEYENNPRLPSFNGAGRLQPQKLGRRKQRRSLSFGGLDIGIGMCLSSPALPRNTRRGRAQRLLLPVHSRQLLLCCFHVVSPPLSLRLLSLLYTPLPQFTNNYLSGSLHSWLGRRTQHAASYDTQYSTYNGDHPTYDESE